MIFKKSIDKKFLKEIMGIGYSRRIATVRKNQIENLGNEELSKINLKNTTESFNKRQDQEN